jgi:hypothetical protein
MRRLVAAVLAPPTDKLAVYIRTATFIRNATSRNPGNDCSIARLAHVFLLLEKPLRP